MNPCKVGILAGIDPFADALFSEINRQGAGEVQAEFCQLSAQELGEEIPYRIIIDRISHCIEFYQPFLKRAALSGCYVINNPFWFPIDDKFFNAEIARKLGINIPKTFCLPSKEQIAGLENGDYRNLAYPVNWQKLSEEIGFPALLKPYDGYGWREVHLVHSLEELLYVYDNSGMDVMLLQEYIDYEHFVRVFVIGKQETLPVHYRPRERKYLLDHQHLTPELGAKIVEDSRKICLALGYDINSVEFAIRDGVPYAIDFMNPVPEAKPEVVTQEYFNWLVEKTAKMVLDYAKRPPKQYPAAILRKLFSPSHRSEVFTA